MGPFEYFVQLLIGGVTTGFIYSLVGLGFVIVFKSTKILNLAQGEFMMSGAYITFALYNLVHLPFLAAFALALVAGYFLGSVVDRVFLKRMVGAPIFSVVMLTVGLSVVLRGLVGLIWGHDERTIVVPLFHQILKGASFSINFGSILVILLCLALVIGFGLFYKFTKTGISMRATATDRNSAMVMGIDIPRVFSVSWGLSSLVSVFGGVVLASITIIKPGMADFGLKALPAVILGGVDSILGVILGGIIVGIAENFVGGYIGGMAQQLSPYVILLVVLVIKPYGLFGTKEIERV
jgi:branched-chain amino acid transport system permease protein